MDSTPNSKLYLEGFTIIEVMIALSILTIGILSIASMQVSAIKGNYLSDKITSAFTLAEDKMEALLGMDYNDPALKDLVPGNNDDLGRIDPGWTDRQELNIDETGKVNAGQFRRIWNIADNRPIENNKTVTVIVTWDNDSHRISLTSVKRR
ncbi:MAG: prepilin-type N-terminal cleavage/methylation domain-containing protein [Desulfobacteraceae bacterium]